MVQGMRASAKAHAHAWAHERGGGEQVGPYDRMGYGGLGVTWEAGGRGCPRFFFAECQLPGIHTPLSSLPQVATVLYVDSPVGTGLSYSQHAADYITDDGQTARDLFAFILEIFNLFPELNERPIYIAGKWQADARPV